MKTFFSLLLCAAFLFCLTIFSPSCRCCCAVVVFKANIAQWREEWNEKNCLFLNRISLHYIYTYIQSSAMLLRYGYYCVYWWMGRTKEKESEHPIRIRIIVETKTMRAREGIRVTPESISSLGGTSDTLRTPKKNHIIHRELSSGPVIEWNENKKLKRVRELSVRTHSNSNTQDEMKWKFLLNLFTYFSLRLGLIWNSPPRLGVFPYKYSKNQHRLFSLCHVSNISFVPFSAVPSFIWNSRNAHKKNERERKRERWDLEKYSTHWDDTILFHPSRPCLQVCCV